MKILLLSRCPSAMGPFLTQVAGTTSRPLRIGYVADAQVAYAAAPFVQAERDAVIALGHEVIDITARHMAAADFDALLSELDAVYVASGSTFALLEALRTSGNDTVITRHVRAGLPYIGSSAGSIIAGPDVTPSSLMDDPADGPSLTDFTGLGLINRTVIPHADGHLPPYPPELISRTLETYGGDYALLPLRDDQALLIHDTNETLIDSQD